MTGTARSGGTTDRVRRALFAFAADQARRTGASDPELTAATALELAERRRIKHPEAFIRKTIQRLVANERRKTRREFPDEKAICEATSTSHTEAQLLALCDGDRVELDETRERVAVWAPGLDLRRLRTLLDERLVHPLACEDAEDLKAIGALFEAFEQARRRAVRPGASAVLSQLVKQIALGFEADDVRFLGTLKSLRDFGPKGPGRRRSGGLASPRERVLAECCRDHVVPALGRWPSSRELAVLGIACGFLAVRARVVTPERVRQLEKAIAKHGLAEARRTSVWEAAHAEVIRVMELGDRLRAPAHAIRRFQELATAVPLQPPASPHEEQLCAEVIELCDQILMFHEKHQHQSEERRASVRAAARQRGLGIVVRKPK